MAKIGLKTTQYSLLSQVMHRGPIRPGDLAKAMALDASTLTRNLKPLAAAGWVMVVSGADSRSHLVAITEAGREKRSEAQRRWKAAQESLNELLGVGRVLDLHDLIDGSLQCFADRESSCLSEDNHEPRSLYHRRDSQPDRQEERRSRARPPR